MFYSNLRFNPVKFKGMDEQHQAKKAKITQFWTSGKTFYICFLLITFSTVATRKNSENLESWKFIRGTVLSKTYGHPLDKGRTYKVFAFDLVRNNFIKSVFNFFRIIL